MTSFGRRWIEHAARHNAEGSESLGDLRRRNGSAASVLKAGRSRKTPPSLERSAGRWRLVCESRGRSRARIGSGEGRCAARLGGAEGLRDVDPNTAPEKPELRLARRGGDVQKTSKTSSRKRPRNIPSGRSRLATIASIGSTSPPSCRPRQARPSGICSMACRSHSSRRCSRPFCA